MKFFYLNLRYRVFNQKASNQPVFSAPWLWLAKHYATSFSANWDYSRIVDAERNKILVEWERASVVAVKKAFRVILKDGAYLVVEAFNDKQVREIVVYGRTLYSLNCFDELVNATRLPIRIHPDNILRIEVLP